MKKDVYIDFYYKTGFTSDATIELRKTFRFEF